MKASELVKLISEGTPGDTEVLFCFDDKLLEPPHFGGAPDLSRARKFILLQEVPGLKPVVSTDPENLDP